MAAAALTTLRTTIATALANVGVWNVFSYPPPVLQVNSVIVAPSDPYVTPSNNSQVSISPMANFNIICVSPYLDNQGNLANIETMIVSVFQKLAASSIVFNILSASAPALLDSPSGAMLTSSFQITVLTTWS
jgi:hypothetical protein